MRTLNITGPINNLSYGNVCCNLVDNLVKQGIQVNLKPIGGINYIDDNLVNSVKIALSNKQDDKSPHIIIWHHGQLNKHKIEKTLNIGFPIFEVSNYTHEEIKDFNSIEKIFVTCDWYKKILQKYIDKEIKIINLGVNNNIFNYKNNIKTNKLTFLNIGKWEIRKGHDILPKILSKALYKSPVNTRIIMLAYNPFLSDEEHKKWETFYKKQLCNCNIEIIINRVKNHKQVAEIINQSDIGLFPSRAEGWNMGLHEMLTCGKTCIVSNFSAHTEYCNKDNSILIGNQENLELEDCFDGQWFFAQSHWLKFTDTMIDEWADSIKDVVFNQKRIKQEVVVDSVKHLTWENSTKEIIKYLWQNS